MSVSIELCLSQSSSYVLMDSEGNQYKYEIPPHLLAILREILYEVIVKTLEDHANVPNEIPLD